MMLAVGFFYVAFRMLLLVLSGHTITMSFTTWKLLYYKVLFINFRLSVCAIAIICRKSFPLGLLVAGSIRGLKSGSLLRMEWHTVCKSRDKWGVGISKDSTNQNEL